MTVLFLSVSACKDDSASSNSASIEITNATVTFIDVNDCDIGSGPEATEFLFTLSIDATPGIDINGVEFDLIWSDGEEDPNIFSEDFNIAEGTLDFDWCFRYGTTEWFELDMKILAEDEEIESNEYNIRVDRPNGANKLFE